MLRAFFGQAFLSAQLVYHALTWPIPAYQIFSPASFPTPTPAPITELTCFQLQISEPHIFPPPTRPAVFATTKPAPPPAVDLNAAVNTYRSRNGLTALEIKADLCGIASQRLKEIATNFNHDGFHNRTESGKFSQLGYSAFAENIWSGTGGPDAVVNSWDKSTGHRTNLLGSYPYGCAIAANSRAVLILAH